MRKLLITTLVAVFCCSVSGGAVLAQTVIENTGPGSENTVIHEDTQDCSVENDNEVDLTNNNPQSGSSGSSNNSGNTGSGNANSGNSSNQSNTNVNADINNGNPCVPETTTTPTPSPQPEGRGAGEVAGIVAPAPASTSAAATTLPETGPVNIVLFALAFGVTITGLAFIVGSKFLAATIS